MVLASHHDEATNFSAGFVSSRLCSPHCSKAPFLEIGERFRPRDATPASEARPVASWSQPLVGHFRGSGPAVLNSRTTNSASNIFGRGRLIRSGSKHCSMITHRLTMSERQHCLGNVNVNSASFSRTGKTVDGREADAQHLPKAVICKKTHVMCSTGEWENSRSFLF